MEKKEFLLSHSLPKALVCCLLWSIHWHTVSGFASSSTGTPTFVFSQGQTLSESFFSLQSRKDSTSPLSSLSPASRRPKQPIAVSPTSTLLLYRNDTSLSATSLLSSSQELLLDEENVQRIEWNHHPYSSQLKDLVLVQHASSYHTTADTNELICSSSSDSATELVVSATSTTASSLPTIPEDNSAISATSVATALQEVSTTTQENDKEREIWVARLLLIGAAALYGTNFPLVKLMGETDLPIGLSTTLRFGLAALATSPWLFAPAKPAADTSQDAVATARTPESSAWGAALGGFEVGMWNSIGYVAQAVGLETTLASKSAFLCSLAVVVVPFLDYLSGRNLKMREWMGAILALAGVAMLELGEATDIFGSWTFGDTASMLQPLAFGLGFWRMERTMAKYPNEANRCTAAQLLAAVIGSALYCGIVESGTATWDLAQLQTWLTDPTLLAFIAWTGIASTALSVYMETIALKTLSAAETTVILSTEPLWGAAFASFIIGEHFGTDAAVGGFLILAGCLYSNLGATGLLSLLSSKLPQQQGSVEKIVNRESVATTKTTTASSATRVLGFGALLAASTGAWNNLSTGARATILQVQDQIDELL